MRSSAIACWLTGERFGLHVETIRNALRKKRGEGLECPERSDAQTNLASLFLDVASHGLCWRLAPGCHDDLGCPVRVGLSAQALAGANLREAVKLGAFAGAEYAEVRHLIEQPDKGQDDMTIDRAILWMLRKKKLPEWVSKRSDAWLPEALFPIADMIDADAARMQQAAPAPAATLVPPCVTVTVPDGFYSPTDIAKAIIAPDKADAIRMALKRLFDENRLPDGA